MAISAAIRPRVIVFGDVTFSREFRRKADNELLGSNINVETEGGPVRVTVWESVEPNPPKVGEVVAFVAEVVEGTGGADLSYARSLGADDLDKLASYTPALAGK
jgi:hypothetical protein